jgi:hypothetical protein
VPVPGANVVWLVLDSPLYLVDVLRTFGEWGDEPALTAGERDQSELRVAAAGALTGRVVDEAGRPIPSASVAVAMRTGFHVRCDADGHYELAHVAPGVVSIRASADEHLPATAKGLAVRAGSTLAAPDLVPAHAPTIAGIVVDERGAAVAGVRVLALALGPGSEAGRAVRPCRGAAAHRWSGPGRGFR